MEGAGCLRSVLLAVATLLLASCVAGARTDLGGARILVFSHTSGYRHDSLAVAVPALVRLIGEEGGEAVASEDPALFSSASLARFRAVVLLSATTDPQRPESEWLTGPGQEALQAFVRAGGGVIGIHAAADSHYHWPWYGRMLGGRFERHPPGTARGRLSVVDPSHPATARLPATIEHVDEWYFIRGFDPRSRVLLTLDPASIGEPGAAAPISWAREYEGSRVFYTALATRRRPTPSPSSSTIFAARCTG